MKGSICESTPTRCCSIDWELTARAGILILLLRERRMDSIIIWMSSVSSCSERMAGGSVLTEDRCSVCHQGLWVPREAGEYRVFISRSLC
jgi:hypothetical protein